MTDDAQPLQRWLDRQPRSLRELLERARHLAAINRALREHWSEYAWGDAIRIANIRGSTVVLYSRSAAALIPLRYRRQALLGFLQQRFGLTCTELDVKVRP